MLPLPEPATAGRVGFAFTENDAPEARARIQRDLERIVAAIETADPKLDALVLTGGFSRGEGTVREGRPVNDYDLVAVRRATGGDALYRELGHRLTKEIGIEVDIMPIARARLPLVGAKLFWLDVKLGGRVLHGEARTLDRLPVIDPRRIPRIEVARLLSNRAAGLLLALPTTSDPQTPEQTDLQATKAVLAAMDATLLGRGEYAAGMRERLARLEGHAHHATFANAVAWKLAPGAPPLGAPWWREAKDVLLAAVASMRARDVGDGMPERAVAALKGRLALHPSRLVRHAAWDLLAGCDHPDGPRDVDEAARIVSTLDQEASASEGWDGLKRRFFAARARTLQ